MVKPGLNTALPILAEVGAAPVVLPSHATVGINKVPVVLEPTPMVVPVP